MPYREKTAWLSLVAMAAAFGPYFAIVSATPPGAELPNLRQLGLFAAATFVQVLILGAGHLYLRLGSPDEARTAPDERDKAILQRSIGWAYYVLIAGTIVAGFVLPFRSSGWSIVNAALVAIIAAELVHYGVVVWSYRAQR